MKLGELFDSYILFYNDENNKPIDAGKNRFAIFSDDCIMVPKELMVSNKDDQDKDTDKLKNKRK